MKRKYIIIGVVTLIAVCLAYWFFRPLPSWDITRVEPRLRALREPYRSVVTYFWLDGGSIGISITDRDGTREQFAIPSDQHTNPYAKVYVGTVHVIWSGPGDAVEVADPENTKWMLVSILHDYPGRKYGDDYVLALLTRRPVDIARFLIEKWMGKADTDSLMVF
jgi:hypothetical protein